MPHPVAASAAASAMSNPTHATSQCWLVWRAGSRYARKSAQGTSTAPASASSGAIHRYGTMSSGRVATGLLYLRDQSVPRPELLLTRRRATCGGLANRIPAG